ncbi:MAG: hypothetical protein ACI3XI_06435 [Eubacteriales bacterium]
MYDLYSIIQALRQVGHVVLPGITDPDKELVKKTYDIVFPRELKNLYELGIPCTFNCSYGFPDWTDFGELNTSEIKRRIDAPLYDLKCSVKDGFWIDTWGERPDEEDKALEVFDELSKQAPKLIPIYSHRYLPIIDGVDDPPVISVAGSDIIYYGCNLSDYINREFFGKRGAISIPSNNRIPFWSDIIDKISI